MFFSGFNHIKLSLFYRAFDPSKFGVISLDLCPVHAHFTFGSLLKNLYKSIFKLYLGSFGPQIRNLHEKLHILICSNHIFMIFLKTRPKIYENTSNPQIRFSKNLILTYIIQLIDGTVRTGLKISMSN